MHAFTQSKRRKFVLIGTLIVLVLALSLTGTVLGDDVTGSVTITGGTLSMSATDDPAFTGVTLDGTDQTTTDSIDIDVKDLTGTGAGWNLQITSTTFTDGSHTLSTTATSITAASAACDGGTCTDPTNGIGYPLTVPADTTPPTAVKFFTAATDTGMGDFTVTPTFQLSIPAATFAGTYNSTMTITSASGP